MKTIQRDLSTGRQAEDALLPPLETQFGVRGKRHNNPLNTPHYMVWKLLSNGALDASYGVGGMAHLVAPDEQQHMELTDATSDRRAGRRDKALYQYSLFTAAGLGRQLSIGIRSTRKTLRPRTLTASMLVIRTLTTITRGSFGITSTKHPGPTSATMKVTGRDWWLRFPREENPEGFAWVGMEAHGNTWRYLPEVLYCDWQPEPGSCGAPGSEGFGQRVMAYVANGSHATYPRPCTGARWQREHRTKAP